MCQACAEFKKERHLPLTLRTAESLTPFAMNVISAVSSALWASWITSECFVWVCCIEYRPPCFSCELLRNQVPTIEADSSMEKWASSPSTTSQLLMWLWILGPGTMRHRKSRCRERREVKTLKSFKNVDTILLCCVLLTEMHNFGKLHVATSSIFIDAADTEAVIAFTGHVVPRHLSRGFGLWGEALLPLLRTHFLPFQDKHGAGGGLAVCSGDPSE